MKKPLNRRQFATRSAILSSVAAGGALVPFRPGMALGQEAAEPHFLLKVLFNGGLDTSYGLDARPLSMTAAKEQTNYLGTEPEKWTDGHGGETLVTSLARPLAPWRDYMTVVNGVVMAANFDGHGQNINFMLTGNPFGGESMMPHLNQGTTPLDYVRAGFLFASISNGGASLPLDPFTIPILQQRLATMPQLSADQGLFKHVMGRYRAVGERPGRMGAGARAMASGFDNAPRVDGIVRDMKVVDESQDPVKGQADMFCGLFNSGLARSGILSISPAAGTLDMHAQGSAQNAEAIIGECMQNLATIISTLRDTPYDDQRSLLDVTTLVAGSEFGRTMRQGYVDFASSGTDHNPLTNTVILAGKGVRTGRIIGRSDRQAPDEVVSKAHQSLDGDAVKVMGRPYDFATGQVSDALPEEYRAGDYLTMPNIANGVYRAFGVDRGWSLERNGPAAAIPNEIFG